MRRLLAALVALPLILAPTPAFAAGTGGVEISPYPGAVNGKQVTAFHVEVPETGPAVVKYSVRNTTDKVVRARLFSAAAHNEGGNWTVGEYGSAPFLGLRDTVVTLRPHESRITSFKALMPAAAGTFGAVVVEVHNGSIVQRAATIVYLGAATAASGISTTFVVIATLLLLCCAGGLAIAKRWRKQLA